MAHPVTASSVAFKVAPAIGVALQNLGASTATVSIELLDRGGNAYAVNTVAVQTNQYFVREIGELFGIVAPPAAFRIRSDTPVQVLGLVTDPEAGTVAALPPK